MSFFSFLVCGLLTHSPGSTSHQSVSSAIMPKFYSNKSFSVAMVLTRCYPTNEKIVNEHGIFFNFSAKVVVTTPEEEIAIMSLNDLSVRQTTDGRFFVGSSGRPNRYKDQDTGETVLNGMIWAAGMFPGSLDSPQLTKLSDKFVKELMTECTQFVRHAQARAKEPRRNFNVPEELKDLIKPPVVREDPKKGHIPL